MRSVSRAMVMVRSDGDASGAASEPAPVVHEKSGLPSGPLLVDGSNILMASVAFSDGPHEQLFLPLSDLTDDPRPRFLTRSRAALLIGRHVPICGKFRFGADFRSFREHISARTQ